MMKHTKKEELSLFYLLYNQKTIIEYNFIKFFVVCKNLINSETQNPCNFVKQTSTNYMFSCWGRIIIKKCQLQSEKEK